MCIEFLLLSPVFSRHFILFEKTNILEKKIRRANRLSTVKRRRKWAKSFEENFKCIAVTCFIFALGAFDLIFEGVWTRWNYEPMCYDVMLPFIKKNFMLRGSNIVHALVDISQVPSKMLSFESSLIITMPCRSFQSRPKSPLAPVLPPIWFVSLN